MPDIAEPPTRPVPPHLVGHAFDKVTAMLAVQRRRELKAQRDAIPALPALTPNLTPDDFNTVRLVRVREQLEKLDKMVKTETDPQKLDRLASAQAKLSAQEFDLSGRPRAGYRKPAPERGSARGMIDLQPLLADEQPAQVQAAAPARPIGNEYDDPPGYVREPVTEPVPPKTD